MSAQSFTLNDVLELTDCLAKEVLDLKMRGRTPPSFKILPLIDVARILRANEVEWPVSLSMAVDALRKEADTAQEPIKQPRRLVGYLDYTGCDSARGWAMDPDAPDEQMQLDILVDGQFIATVTANLPRPDVAAAGFGNGSQGFCLVFDPPLPSDKPHTITVRRTADGVAMGPWDAAADE